MKNLNSNKEQNLQIFVIKNYEQLKQLIRHISIAEYNQLVMERENFLEDGDKINPTEYVLVDTARHKLLSLASVEDYENGVRHISSLYTPDHTERKKGYASRVLDEIFEISKNEGFRYIHLNAMGEAGKRIYRKKGFVPVSRDIEFETIDFVSSYKILNEKNWQYSKVFYNVLRDIDGTKKTVAEGFDDLKPLISSNAYGENWEGYNDPILNVMSNIIEYARSMEDNNFKKTFIKLNFDRNDDSVSTHEFLNKRYDDIKDILNGIRLLNASEKYIASRKVDTKSVTETQPKISTKRAKILNVVKKDDKDAVKERTYKGY